MSSEVEAEWRGSAEDVESTLMYLLKALELCKSSDIMSKIVDIWKELQSNTEQNANPDTRGDRFSIDASLFEHVKSAIKIVYEKLNERMSNDYRDKNDDQTKQMNEVIITLTDRHTSNIKDLVKENNDLASKNEYLSNEIGNLNIKYSKLAKENSDLISKNGELTKANIDLANKNGELTKANSDLESKNGALTKANSDLASKNGELTKANSDLANKNGELTKANSGLESKNGELAKANSDLAGKNGELTKANSDLTSKNGELTKANSDLASKNLELTKANSDLASKNGELTIANSDLASKNGDLTKANSDLACKDGDLAKANSELVSTNGDLTIENTSLTNHVTALTNNIYNIYTALTKNIRGLTNIFNKVTTKLNSESLEKCVVVSKFEDEKKSKEEITESYDKLKSLCGTLRLQVVIGLNTGALEQKICLINLNRKDTIYVINSTPAWIGVESAACVINNVLYAVGIGSARNELWKWSAERNEWTRFADLPSGRRRHCATGVGEKIYVLGGWVDADEKTLDSILCYDINSNNWTQVTQLCHAVWGAACMTYKHFIYVFGGFDKGDKSVNHVQVYDTFTGKITLSSNPMPAAQILMRAVLWRSKALLIGWNTCYIYDFERRSWEVRKRFKTDVSPFGLTLNDDTLYISGGGRSRTDENNEGVWTCSDEVKSLSVDDFISNNQQAEWKHHAKLPRPACVYSFNSQALNY